MDLSAGQFTSLSDEQAALILDEGWSLRPDEVRRLPSERDDTFVCTSTAWTVVLKVAAPDEDDAELELQCLAAAWAQDHAEGLKISSAVPGVDGQLLRPVTGVDRRRRVARVLRFVPGSEIDYSRSTKPLRQCVGRTAARLSLALVGFEHPAATRPHRWDLRRAPMLMTHLNDVDDPSSRDAAGHVLDVFRSQVAGPLDRTPFQAVHGDLNGHNLLFRSSGSKTRMGIVDFGDVIRTARVVELAVAAAYAADATIDSPDPWAGVQDVVDGYLQVRPLAAEELRLVPDLVRTRLAQKVVLHSRMSRQCPSNAAYLGRSLQSASHALTTLLCTSEPDLLDASHGADT